LSIAHVSPFPFIILLAVMLVAIAVCFYRFPSLRSIRKPRNLLVYLIMLLLLGSVAYQVYDAFLGVSVVTYDANTLSFADNEFVAGQVFELEVFCENLGMRETTFYLTLTSTNASLTVGSQQNYIQVNNTAIKIPFHFASASMHAKERKSVSVTIDGSASGFQIDFDSSVIATGGVNGVKGQWNQTANGYAVTTKLGPCV
jgi:hypothetical protein